MNPASLGKGRSRLSHRSRPRNCAARLPEVAVLMVLRRPHSVTCHPWADVA